MRVVLSILLGLATVSAAAAVTVPGDFSSIQAAIDGAPDGATIDIAPGTYEEQLILQDVGRTLTIRGDVGSPSSVVIDGGGKPGSTVTLVRCGAGVVFEGLTITGGTGGDGIGGGLFMANSQSLFRHVVFTGNSNTKDGGGAFILTSGGLFTECVFTQNSSTRFGGGVFMNVGSTTIFQRCEFTNNTSGTGDDIEGWGGGLHVNDSAPMLIGCAINGNTSKFAGGGLSITGHFNVPEQHVVLQDCEIGDNEAVRGNPSISAADGGGMHIEDNVLAVLDRCHVHDNVSSNGGGLSSFRGTYDVRDSLIEDNQAVPKTPDAEGGYGGGIMAVSVNTSEPARKPSSVTLRRTVVRNNSAHVGGGMIVQGDFLLTDNRATLLLEDSLVAANTVTGRAGGFFLDRTDATLRRSHVLLNTVTATNDSWGGGVAAVGGADVTIEDTAICANTAQELGGGIYADQGSVLQVSNSILHDNAAASGNGLGGGAIAVAAASGPNPGPVTGSVHDSVITANGVGPEIWESDCDPPTWSDVQYEDNAIHANGGVYFRNCSGATNTVAGFNGLVGKASGNVNQNPDIGEFLATPSTIAAGATSVLSWCTSVGSGLSIDQGVGSVTGNVGMKDVQPDTSTTYHLKDGGTTIGTASVEVACMAIDIPLPHTPTNGRDGVSAGEAMVAWHAAAGATAYSVYLDTNAIPTTLVASNLTGTTATVAGLAKNTTYQWKVVATGPACPEPVASPVFQFTTCAGTVCFADDFGDADLADWTPVGKGSVDPNFGRMRLRGKKKLAMIAPAGVLGAGEVSSLVEFKEGRGEVRLLFGYQGPTTYRALVMRRSGKVRFEDVAGGKRRVALGAWSPPGVGFLVKLVINGGDVEASVDGTPVLAGAFGAATAGEVAIQSIKTVLMIDDVRVEGEP